MPAARAAALLLATLALAAGLASAQQPACTSRAVGKPWHGHLVCGVQLPAESATFVTWDFPLGRTPNRPWRRWGTAKLVATVEQIAADYRLRFGPGPRLVVGDLSRTHGGPFGSRFGGPGHQSHQNGLDVDIFLPRRDRLERPPLRPGDVDRPRAQWLVDRAAALAQVVFIGERVGIRRTRPDIQYLKRYHDNHVHVRISP